MVSIIISAISAIIALSSAYIAWRATKPLPDLLVTLTVVEQIGRAFLVHFQVTNRSTQPVQLATYRLALVLENGTEVPAPASETWIVRVVQLNLGGLFSDGSLQVEFHDDNFADWPPKVVGYGELALGFLLFGVPEGLSEADRVAAYKLTFIDALGGIWTARITPAEIFEFEHNQHFHTPNWVQLFKAAGARMTKVKERASEATP